jgi:hypothetical protein
MVTFLITGMNSLGEQARAWRRHRTKSYPKSAGARYHGGAELLLFRAAEARSQAAGGLSLSAHPGVKDFVTPLQEPSRYTWLCHITQHVGVQ